MAEARILGSRKNLLLASYLVLTLVLNLFLYLVVLPAQDSKIEEVGNSYLKERSLIEKARGALEAGERESPPGEELRLLAGREQTRVIDRVSTLAEELGLTLRPLAFRPEKGEEGLTRLVVTIPLKGPYPELKEFIYEMETWSIPFIIEDMTIKRGEIGAEEVELDMLLSTYLKG